ncbi:MAG: hypothetical protein OSB27_04485 [Planktomarina sp.]|nr:hypothetical protein [Planktomarina sp.]
MKYPLWIPRPVSEALDIYAKLANSCVSGLKEASYESPRRSLKAMGSDGIVLKQL